MEALRKAEAAKRAGQQADDSAPGLPAPELASDDNYEDEYHPTPEVFKYATPEELMALLPSDEPEAAPPQAYSSPEKTAPVTDDVLDDYLSDHPDAEHEEAPPSRPERERVKVQQQRQRAAAASMFNAKAPPESEINKQRRLLILSGALLVVALIVGGGWWYITTLSSSSIGVNPAVANYNPANRGFLDSQPAATANPPAATATSAVPVTEPTPAPTVALTVTSTTTDVAPPANDIPPATAPVPVAPADELAVSDPQLDAPYAEDPRDAVATGEPAQVADLLPAAQVAVNEPPTTGASAGTTLEISRAGAANPIQPTLQSAYNKLLQGEISAANELYQEVLSQFPNNRDALLGLAAVQLKLDNANGARSTYARLLQLNPQDALARTGMLQSLPVMDPDAYETELLALRQRFPTLAPLNFALGNHYASKQLWHEAQSAYFDALLQARREAGAGPSPDYAFNLAVSLEQLGQRDAALEYYKEAQSLANSIKPGFDPMMLRQRLSELEQRQ